MSSKMASSNSNTGITGPLARGVIDAQTNAENGGKLTKYKLSVNYNGQEWDLWKRYKEFHTLNGKLRRVRSDLELPGRRLLGDSFESDFVLKRQHSLNEYVQKISTNFLIVNLPEFIGFFDLNTTSNARRYDSLDPRLNPI